MGIPARWAGALLAVLLALVAATPALQATPATQEAAAAAPRAVPGLIQAEDYDQGGEGVGYHDASAGNEGQVYRSDDVDIKVVPDGATVIGWFQNGEWLNYTVDTGEGGTFDITVRTGSAYSPERYLAIALDGSELGRLTAPPIPDWLAPLRETTLRGVRLPGGVHILTLKVVGEDWLDVDWLNVTPTTAETAPVAIEPAPVPVPVPVEAAPCATTLQSLLDAAPAGAVLTVPGCVFRETIVIRKPVTLNGSAGTEIRGSDVWSDWTGTGPRWVSQKTVPPLSTDRHVECVAERCHWQEQVFLDGRALEQVAPATDPGPGQFAVDGSRRVVLADDPTGHTVEVTVRQRWAEVQADGVSIAGFVMRHAANEPQSGAIGNQSRSDFTLSDSRLSDTHGPIVSLGGGSNVKVLRNDIARGGQQGISGYRNNNTLIQGNTIYGNNTEGFKPEWEGGGVKLVQFTNAVIDNNDTYDNNGPGLWCDILCKSVTFSNNRIHDNLGPGVFFEISEGADIAHNVIWNTRGTWPAISVSSSSGADVHDNLVAWSNAGISVLWNDRPDRPGSGATGNVVRNNTIVMRQPDGVALEWAQYGQGGRMFDGDARNSGAANRYWYPAAEDGKPRFAWQGPRPNLADFNATPGGKDGRYLSTAERDQVLAASNVPL